MSYSKGGGRLGNKIIRNLASSILAEKFDLSICYFYYKENCCDTETIEKLGIKLFTGSKEYTNTVELTDKNYLYILNLDNFEYNFSSQDYLQTKEITNILYKHINTNLKENIISSNKFRERYNNNNDCFVHIRLGDVVHFNPGSDYYLKTLKGIKFDNLYIASDSLDHNIIKNIVEKYPNAKLIDYDEVDTIHFGSTNKHVILSHGSFSAIIGYFAFFSDVYYPEYIHTIWFGDMFSIEEWNKMLL